MAKSSDPLHLQFATNVRRLMREKKLSLNHLADFSGVGRGRMSDLLAGKGSPTLRTLGRVAAALDVQVVDLLRSP